MKKIEREREREVTIIKREARCTAAAWCNRFRSPRACDISLWWKNWIFETWRPITRGNRSCIRHEVPSDVYLCYAWLPGGEPPELLVMFMKANAPLGFRASRILSNIRLHCATVSNMYPMSVYLRAVDVLLPAHAHASRVTVMPLYLHFIGR